MRKKESKKKRKIQVKYVRKMKEVRKGKNKRSTGVRKIGMKRKKIKGWKK